MLSSKSGRVWCVVAGLLVVGSLCVASAAAADERDDDEQNETDRSRDRRPDVGRAPIVIRSGSGDDRDAQHRRQMRRLGIGNAPIVIRSGGAGEETAQTGRARNRVRMYGYTVRSEQGSGEAGRVVRPAAPPSGTVRYSPDTLTLVRTEPSSSGAPDPEFVIEREGEPLPGLSAMRWVDGAVYLCGAQETDLLRWERTEDDEHELATLAESVGKITAISRSPGGDLVVSLVNGPILRVREDGSTEPIVTDVEGRVFSTIPAMTHDDDGTLYFSHLARESSAPENAARTGMYAKAVDGRPKLIHSIPMREAGAHYFDVSRDGRWLAYVTPGSKSVELVDIDGEGPQKKQTIRFGRVHPICPRFDAKGRLYVKDAWHIHIFKMKAHGPERLYQFTIDRQHEHKQSFQFAIGGEEDEYLLVDYPNHGVYAYDNPAERDDGGKWAVGTVYGGASALADAVVINREPDALAWTHSLQWMDGGLLHGSIQELHRWTPEEGIGNVEATVGSLELVTDQAKYVRGVDRSPEGDLVIAENAGRISRVRSDGSLELLLDSVDGMELVTIDEIEYGPDGTLWFSHRCSSPKKASELTEPHPAFGLYAMRPDGEVRLVYPTEYMIVSFDVSDDGRRVVINEMYEEATPESERAWGGGALSESMILLDFDEGLETPRVTRHRVGHGAGRPQFDAQGRIWVMFWGAIQVYDEGFQAIRTIRTNRSGPSTYHTHFCLGGENEELLFIRYGDGIFKIDNPMMAAGDGLNDR